MTSKTIIDWEMGIIHIHVSKAQRRELTRAEAKQVGRWKHEMARAEAKLVKFLGRKGQITEVL